MSEDTAIPNSTLHRIIDFNFFPSMGMDDSWWKPEWLVTPLFVRVGSTKAAHRKLSDFILENYRLKHENYFDFESYERQAALLNSTDLKSLLYTIGLITESGTIAGTIEREAQQIIKKSLGETDYLYALKNRIFIRPQRENKVLTIDQKTHNITDFKDSIYRSGLRCLLSLLDDTPQGFIQRILFKLPKAWSATTSLSRHKDDCLEIKACLPRLFKELKIA